MLVFCVFPSSSPGKKFRGTRAVEITNKEVYVTQKHNNLINCELFAPPRELIVSKSAGQKCRVPAELIVATLCDRGATNGLFVASRNDYL